MTKHSRLILSDDGEWAFGRLSHSIARTLDDLLRKERVKQRELAARTGMNEAAVSRVLDGSRNVEIRTLGALAGALGYVFDVVPRRIRADPNERNNRPTTKVMGQLADSTIPKTAEHLASPPTRPGPIMTATALTVSHV